MTQQGKRVWITTIGVIGLTIGFLGASVLAHFAAVRTPMTIHYAIQDASGARQSSGGYTMYYRSDGASVFENLGTPSPRGLLRPTRIISLPRQATMMNFDPETNMVFTFGMGSSEIYASQRRVARSDSQSSCMKELVALLGPGSDRVCESTGELVLGFKVWKTRARVGPRDRPVIFETYLAPALDWRLLKQDSIEKGKLIGRIVATNVTLGDPSDQLFRVPRTAKVVTTREYGKAGRQARGQPRCESCEAAAEDGPLVNKVPPVY